MKRDFPEAFRDDTNWDDPKWDDPKWDFYNNGHINLSDCMDRDYVRRIMDFMGVPQNNENRRKYERLVVALEKQL